MIQISAERAFKVRARRKPIERRGRSQKLFRLALQNGAQQGIFTGEIMIDKCPRHVGILGDGLDGHRLVIRAGIVRRSHLEDLLTSFVRIKTNAVLTV